jgi:hypothetical protein
MCTGSVLMPICEIIVVTSILDCRSGFSSVPLVAWEGSL